MSRKPLPSAPAARPGDVRGAGRERRRAGGRVRGAGPKAAPPVRPMGFGGGRVRALSRRCPFGCCAVSVPGRWVCARPQRWVEVLGSLSFAPAAAGEPPQPRSAGMCDLGDAQVAFPQRRCPRPPQAAAGRAVPGSREVTAGDGARFLGSAFPVCVQFFRRNSRLELAGSARAS